jgi:hypothetical protein
VLSRVEEGRVTDKIFEFGEGRKYLQEFAYRGCVTLRSCKQVIPMNAALNRRDQDLICRRHTIAVLIDKFLSYGSVPAGARRDAII